MPQTVILEFDDIPLGMDVHIVLPGETTPARDEKGVLPPLRVLISGVRDMERRLVPVQDIDRLLYTKCCSISALQPRPGIRFAPAYQFVFVPYAPVRTDFAVFKDNRPLLYSSIEDGWGNDVVMVYKADDGRLYHCGRYQNVLSGHEFQLPPDAMIATVGTRGMASPPFRLRAA